MNSIRIPLKEVALITALLVGFSAYGMDQKKLNLCEKLEKSFFLIEFEQKKVFVPSRFYVSMPRHDDFGADMSFFSPSSEAVDQECFNFSVGEIHFGKLKNFNASFRRKDVDSFVVDFYKGIEYKYKDTMVGNMLYREVFLVNSDSFIFAADTDIDFLNDLLEQLGEKSEMK